MKKLIDKIKRWVNKKAVPWLKKWALKIAIQFVNAIIIIFAANKLMEAEMNGAAVLVGIWTLVFIMYWLIKGAKKAYEWGQKNR